MHTPVLPVVARSITISAVPIAKAEIVTEPGMRFIRGWALVSSDPEFGGLSGLETDGSRFMAVSDMGLIVRFALDSETSRVSDARIQPLPRGCAADTLKYERDAEALTRDPVTGTVWIGFEWQSRLCRTDANLINANALFVPPEMQRWARATGLEALARLPDGRFLAIEERPDDGAFIGPALLWPRDPARGDVRPQAIRYALPQPYFRPTDAAALPDGRVLVLHRSFKPPFTFRGKIAILDAVPARPIQPLKARVIATLSPPGIADNFEGLAISQTKDGRTFVWIISDDNYLWLQRTYLLQFELEPQGQRSGGD